MSMRPALRIQFAELDADGATGADWRVVLADTFPRAGESVWLPDDDTTERLYTIERVEWSGEWPSGTPDDPGSGMIDATHYVRPLAGVPTRALCR